MFDLLVMAHLDDEIIWVDPSLFKKIVVCYGGPGRDQALALHPLRDRIEWLEIPERSHRDHPDQIEESQAIRIALIAHRGAGTVFTHNPWGEMGHSHHRAVYRAVAATFETVHFSTFDRNCLNKKDYKNKITLPFDFLFFERTKILYKLLNLWTGFDLYPMPCFERDYYVDVRMHN